VLVLGDTNSRYTRDGDVLPEMLAAASLVDVWIELSRAGVIPAIGASLTDCGGDETGADCERVDKVMYRSSAGLLLQAVDYEIPANFVDALGAPLSDHDPVAVRFEWSVVPEPASIALFAAGLVLLARSGSRQNGGPIGAICRRFADSPPILPESRHRNPPDRHKGMDLVQAARGASDGGAPDARRSRSERGKRSTMASEVAIIETVKSYILEEFLPGEDPAALTESTPLITSGVLDSISVLKVVNFLEDTFQLSVAPHEADAEHLDTLKDIAALVVSKLAA
jgi:acyl carrier protein